MTKEQQRVIDLCGIGAVIACPTLIACVGFGSILPAILAMLVFIAITKINKPIKGELKMFEITTCAARKTQEMKMEALLKYLKVKMHHVPEHYVCVKEGDQEQDNPQLRSRESD